MSISLHQRAIQIADDLDEQASRLNIYILMLRSDLSLKSI
jgi:hypothetical protein